MPLVDKILNRNSNTDVHNWFIFSYLCIDFTALVFLSEFLAHINQDQALDLVPNYQDLYLAHDKCQQYNVILETYVELPEMLCH